MAEHGARWPYGIDGAERQVAALDDGKLEYRRDVQEVQ